MTDKQPETSNLYIQFTRTGVPQAVDFFVLMHNDSKSSNKRRCRFRFYLQTGKFAVVISTFHF